MDSDANSDYRNVRTIANLEKFTVSEKSGKLRIKSGNREILRRFIFFLYPRMTINMKHEKSVLEKH